MTEAEEKAVEKQLDYVTEVSKNARTTWFGLIALMLFCGVTLLDVQDRDFFEYGASTQLPLIGVTVPTEHFFWAAPVLVTGLYTYLHLYLDKLWRALSRLNDEIDHRPVTEVVYPWLISDTALEMRKNIDRRPYWFVTRFVTLCLCWLIGPVIMVLFWWYSWAPHKEWLTTLIGLQLVWLTSVGVSSWLAMRHRAKSSEPLTIKGLWFVTASVFLLLSWIVISYGWAKTEDGRWWALPGEPNAETAYLYSANLYRANFVKPDKDWKGRDAAWRAYQRAHRDDVIQELKRRSGSEKKPKEKDILERLEAEFKEDRSEERDALEHHNHRGDDLRRANLREAVLVGVDLTAARLEGADLTAARLEGATLIFSKLEGANLRAARLEESDLSESRLEGANMRFVRLKGADLRGTGLEGAVLSGASLEGADLRSARLEGTILYHARLEKAKLSGAEVTDASFFFASLAGSTLNQIRNMTQVQLDEMYGDASTDLSGSGLQRPDHWSPVEISEDQYDACWKQWGLNRITLGNPHLLFGKLGVPSFFPETDIECTAHFDSK